VAMGEPSWVALAASGTSHLDTHSATTSILFHHDFDGMAIWVLLCVNLWMYNRGDTDRKEAVRA